MSDLPVLPAPAIDEASSESVAQFVRSQWPRWRGEACNYAMSLRQSNGWLFYLSHQADHPTAIASATAALLLQFLDRLGELSARDRRDWAEQLLGCLDGDGMCRDEADLADPTQEQPMWALRAHRTRHIAWAIEALGEGLRTPIELAQAYCDPDAIDEEIDRLLPPRGATNIWAAGNWLMDLGVLLDLQHRHFADHAARRTITRLLDGLAQRIDRRTGFWSCGSGNRRHEMAGAMHLYPLFWAYGREVPAFREAVLQTLAMQQADGLFGETSGEGGSQCLDFDAVFILCNGHHLFPHLRPRIESACARVLTAIHVNRLESGAWSDARFIHRPRHWATRACGYFTDGGSLWDTYARLMTVGMCTHVLAPESLLSISAEHHLFEMWSGQSSWHEGAPGAALMGESR